jgi:hypothetical protein
VTEGLDLFAEQEVPTVAEPVVQRLELTALMPWLNEASL